MDAGKWYNFTGSFSSAISFTEWDLICVVFTQKAPNNTSYYYLDNLHLFVS
jgi:hypothetical protein